GSGTVAFKTDGVQNQFSVGLNNVDTTFSGNLTGNDLVSGIPRDLLLKNGSGTLTLSASNSFTGTYFIFSGTVLVTGSIASSPAQVQVVSSAVVGGVGTIDRPVAMSTGGHLAPGTSPGVLNTGGLQFGNGAG